MADERIRSLLLLDADADERRLISAIAARAGWSVAAACDEKTAKSLLRGPHGRDIHPVPESAADTGTNENNDVEHKPPTAAQVRS